MATPFDQFPRPEIEEERGPRVGLWLLVGFLILVVLLAALWSWFFLAEGERKVPAQESDLVRRLDDLQREFVALQQSHARLERRIDQQEEQLQARLDQYMERVESEMARLRREIEARDRRLLSRMEFLERFLQETQGGVMVADAAYLLSVAIQKLQLLGDLPSALRAMEAADEILRRIEGDPALLKVREALAKEIAALKAVKAPDPVQITARLSRLQEEAAALPLAYPTPRRRSLQQNRPQGGLGVWRQIFTVRSQRLDRPVEGVLTEAQAAAIRQVLQLKLESAKMAALRGDATLYRRLLSESEAWVKAHFNTEAKAVQAFLEELEALREQPVAIEIPPVGQALSLLQRLPQLRLELERQGEERSETETGAQEEPRSDRPEGEDRIR